MLRPDLYLSSVRAIDLDALAADGIKAILLDIDNTLLPRGTTQVPDDLVAWTERLRARGFSVLLISNSWHAVTRHRADDLGLEIITKAMKPFPFAFWAAMRRLGVRARESVVVGDQLLTDILGGRLAGAATVLVEPLSQIDLAHTLVLRRLERVIMHGQRPTA